MRCHLLDVANAAMHELNARGQGTRRWGTYIHLKGPSIREATPEEARRMEENYFHPGNNIEPEAWEDREVMRERWHLNHALEDNRRTFQVEAAD